MVKSLGLAIALWVSSLSLPILVADAQLPVEDIQQIERDGTKGDLQSEQPTVNWMVAAVSERMIGVMETTAQAERNPDFVAVRMTTCPIELQDGMTDEETDSIYLYQEQALLSDLDAPYRQRFLQVGLGETGWIEVRSWRPEGTLQWVGFCAETERQVTMNALGEEACTLSFFPAPTEGFVGSTPPEGCATTARGAVRITNTVTLRRDGMDTWDRGFDENGVQVWGAEIFPYEFRR